MYDTMVFDREASQVSKSADLIPIMYSYGSLDKIIMSGDTAQLPPIVISHI